MIYKTLYFIYDNLRLFLKKLKKHPKNAHQIFKSDTRRIQILFNIYNVEQTTIISALTFDNISIKVDAIKFFFI